MTYKKRQERIILSMHRKGVTQMWLAEKAMITRQLVSKAVNDKVNEVRESTMQRIEEALEINK